MAFKRFTSRQVGTTPAAVGTYTVPSSTVATIIGLSVSNRSNEAVECSVYHRDNSANETFLARFIPVPYGASVVVVGGSQKIVLESGDQIFVESSAASSIDAFMSVLEVDQ